MHMCFSQAGCSVDSNQDAETPHIGGVCFAKAFIDGLETDPVDVAVEPDETIADAIESSQDDSKVCYLLFIHDLSFK